MRSAALLFLLLAAGCRGATRQSDPDPASRVATMDTATARRICQSPDSVIAGTKECVLLDQGRPGGPQRSQPARRAP